MHYHPQGQPITGWWPRRDELVKQPIQELEDTQRPVRVPKSSARHLSEGLFDEKELQDIDCDTCVIVDNFKMKILPCWFCENQKNFFGKKGASFMIIFNPFDPENCTAATKKTEFVMMLTDDKGQD